MMDGFNLEALATRARIVLRRTDGGMYKCLAINKGLPLSAYAMQAEIRLRYFPRETIRVVCWGWTTYKQICIDHKLDWRQCVYVCHTEDLRNAARVIVDLASLERSPQPNAAAVIEAARPFTPAL